MAPFHPATLTGGAIAALGAFALLTGCGSSNAPATQGTTAGTATAPTRLLATVCNMTDAKLGVAVTSPAGAPEQVSPAGCGGQEDAVVIAQTTDPCTIKMRITWPSSGGAGTSATLGFVASPTWSGVIVGTRNCTTAGEATAGYATGPETRTFGTLAGYPIDINQGPTDEYAHISVTIWPVGTAQADMD